MSTDPRRTQLRREARALWRAFDRALATQIYLLRDLEAAEELAECVALALLIARADRQLTALGTDLDQLDEEFRR